MTIHYRSWPQNFVGAHDLSFSSAHFLPGSVMKNIIFPGSKFCA